MNEQELLYYLKKQGINIANITRKETGPSNEWTEAEQKNDCCETVPDAHPCVEDSLIEPWNGAGDTVEFEDHTQIVNETLNRLGLERHELNVKIKYEGPSPCGEKTTRWRYTLPCCDDPNIPNLNPVSGHSQLRPDSTPYSFIVQGGQPPIIWSVEGAGLSVSGSKWTGVVRANSCFCKGKVIATDSCDQVVYWDVSSEDGSWNQDTGYSQCDYGGEADSPFPAWVEPGPTDGWGSGLTLLSWEEENYMVSQQFNGKASAATAEELDGEISFVCTSDAKTADACVTPQTANGWQPCPTRDDVWYAVAETAWGGKQYLVASQRATGTITAYEWECPDISELEYDQVDSAGVIADNSSGLVKWSGGTPPYTVSLSGVNFFADVDLKQTQIQTSGTQLYVFTGDACGTCYVTVTDSCGSSDTGTVRSTDGVWKGRCGAVTWNYTGPSTPYACRAMYSKLPYYNTNDPGHCIYIDNAHAVLKPAYQGTLKTWTWKGSYWNLSYQETLGFCIDDWTSGAGGDIWGINTIKAEAEKVGLLWVDGTTDITSVYPDGPPENYLPENEGSCQACWFEC